MKNRFLKAALISVTSIILASCAAGGSGTAAVSDDGIIPSNLKIALLTPVFKFGSAGTTDDGSELGTGKLIFNSLAKRTSASWLSPEESVILIQNANNLNEYESFLDVYQKTGIPDKQGLRKISAAVMCPYIALCQIDHRVTGSDATSHYRLTSITIQVISASDGKVLLEITGNADCGSGGHDIGIVRLIQKAVDEAVSYFPGAKPIGS